VQAAFGWAICAAQRLKALGAFTLSFKAGSPAWLASSTMSPPEGGLHRPPERHTPKSE
jgi:hypothetical protein